VTGVVTLAGLSKSYRHQRALEAVDLEIEAGEIFGYLGPNGAGKTTTIRILMGFLKPSSGNALVFGLDSWKDSVRVHARIGYVPGELHLYNRLTGHETIAYFARLRSQRRAKESATYRRNADDLAQRFNLDLGQRVAALSRGNKQKLAIVQAFMAQPDLVLLDEPSSGLDPLMQQEFHDLLRELKSRGGTALLSSHVLDEVQRIADRVGIIRNGQVVSIDRLETLRAKAMHKVDVRLGEPVKAEVFQDIPGIQDLLIQNHSIHCGLPESSLDALIKALGSFRVLDVAITEADLEEMFLAFYNRAESDAAKHHD
jgi:ABC-2 type transport system ATP-binding protein